MSIYRKLSPSALILVPTRELGVQILSTIHTFKQASPHLQLTMNFLPPPVGTPLSKFQVPEIAVATPGGLADFVLIKKPKAKRNLEDFMTRTKVVVLDEADLILSHPQHLSLIKHKAFRGVRWEQHAEKREMIAVKDTERQFIFVGATLPSISRKSVGDPWSVIQHYFPEAKQINNVGTHSVPVTLSEEFIRLAESNQDLSKERERDLRFDGLSIYLDRALEELEISEKKVNMTWIVFTNSVICCSQVYEKLREQINDITTAVEIKIDHVHAEMTKEEKRQKTMKYCSPVTDANKILRILVCTDVLSRGIDFVEVDTVFHFDFPLTATTYLHRVGRSARNGKSGKSIALIGPKDEALASIIESASRKRALKMDNERLQEVTETEAETAILQDAVMVSV